jgi:hypothetical protein
MTEDVSREVVERTISIICEWWQQVGEQTEPDNHLDRANIYERLKNEGVEVHEDALNHLLVALAQDGKIKLTFGAHWMTVTEVLNPELCQ